MPHSFDGTLAGEPSVELQRRGDTIEEAYEFMLAYAAQGLGSEQQTSAGAPLRTFLERTAAALDGFGDLFRHLIERERIEPAERYLAFVDVLDRDARSALAAVQLVLAQSTISSQLIDNLNASIHLRALLTDVFLIDEILKTRATARR
jgi:hypothetical protein